VNYSSVISDNSINAAGEPNLKRRSVKTFVGYVVSGMTRADAKRVS